MKKLLSDSGSSWPSWVIALLGFSMVVGPLYLGSTVSLIGLYDEGAILTSAFRMFGGEVPVRDFDQVYGPAESGILYLLSGSDGPELLHLRFLRYGSYALAAFFATLGAARLGGGLASLLAAALVLEFATPLTGPAFALGLTSVVLADLANSANLSPSPSPTPARSKLLLVAAGLAAGLGLLFRFTFGALGCIAAFAVIASARSRSDGASSLREGLSRASLFAAGIAPSVVLLGGLVAAGRARLTSALNYGALVDYRSLPFPIPPPPGTSLLVTLKTLIFAGLPFLVLLASTITLLFLLAKRARLSPMQTRRMGLQAGLTLLLAGLLPYALIRADQPHFYPALIVSGCIGAGLLGRLGSLIPSRLWGSRLWGVLGVCILLALGVLSARHMRQAWAVRSSLDRVESAHAPLRGLFVDRKFEAYYATASQLVRSMSQPEDRLFVGSLDHQRIVMSDTLLYAISDRRPATRHTCFNPGQTTSEAKQSEMISDLTASKPPVVFLVPSWREEPNRSSEVGSDLLDRYLQQNYRTHRKVGHSLLMVRREDAK